MPLQTALPVIFAVAVFATMGGASAQTEQKVWTDAPVPGTLPSDGAPADRAGNGTTRDSSTPFSGLPSGARSGQQSDQTNRDGSPATGSITPNLSR